MLPIREFLTAALIEGLCRRCGHRWRERVLGPLVTILACVWKEQQLKSVRQTEDWLATFAPHSGSPNRDGHDFCDARARLPVSVFSKCMQYAGEIASKSGRSIYKGLRICLVDGTTLMTPRSKANLHAFGTSRNQYSVSALPLMRIVMLFCAGSGAVLDMAFGPYCVGEMRLFLLMLRRFRPGDLVIGDSLYGSYLAMGLLQKNHCHGLFFIHHSRRDNRVETLGLNDEIHLWRKPYAKNATTPALLALVPDTLTVRIIRRTIHRQGYRDITIVLCTTLLDPFEYPADELVELYARRWNVEIDIRVLKRDHSLWRLTTQTPQTVVREMYSGVLAYNCTRALIAQASGGDSGQISYSRALSFIVEYCAKMSSASTIHLPQLFMDLLLLISQSIVSDQDRPPEPRMLVVNPVRFPYLKVTRDEWRRRVLSA